MKDEIKKIVSFFGVDTDDTSIDKLENYIFLLEKWNKAYNLTAIRNREEMLQKHLIDSLSIASHISGEKLIDVGTGAGLPGIPLAIVFPEKHFDLLDSNGKKTRFLQQARQQLQIDNITVINQRVEDYHPGPVYDAVLSRAFASLKDMLDGTEHLCKENGCFLAMKGQYPERELQEIKKPYKVLSITWPGNQADRHLIIISQSPRG